MTFAFKFMAELYSRVGKLNQETVKSENEKMATYGKRVKTVVRANKNYKVEKETFNILEYS